MRPPRASALRSIRCKAGPGPWKWGPFPEYYAKLARNIESRLAIILDPMLATGGSLIATIDILKKRGCRHICSLNLVCAPEGIARVQAKHPDVEIYTAAVDSHLNEHGYIIPGLGDAGDRIFGTK